MANSYVRYTATAGQTVFTFPFSYLQEAHIGCTRNPDSDTPETITDFTISAGTPNSLTVGGSITVAEGDVIEVRRTTPRDEASREVVFTQPSVIRADDLNTQGLQNLYIAQEAFDDASDADDKAETFQTAITLAQATADNAVAIAKSAGASATLNAAELARVQSGSAYGSDASEVQFRSLIGAHGWNGNYDGWQAHDGGYIETSYRALGALRVPAYTMRHGGFLRCEIWGEVLNTDIPAQGSAKNLTFRLASEPHPPTTATVLATQAIYNGTGGGFVNYGDLPADTQLPFHLVVDIVPCGRYKTQVTIGGQIGRNNGIIEQLGGVAPSDTLGNLATRVDDVCKVLRQYNSRKHITTIQGKDSYSTGDYAEAGLDGTYMTAELTGSGGTNFQTGDVVTFKDGTVAGPNVTVGFGTTGESIDVTLGASLSDTLDNFEEAVAESTLRLFTYRSGDVVYICPPYAGDDEYGHANLSLTATTTGGGSGLSVTDFRALDGDDNPVADPDNGKVDWQTDQDFVFHLKAAGVHAWVYNIQAYQIGGTKGWEAPLR